MILHAHWQKHIRKLEVWFFIYPRRPPLPPGLAKDHTFFHFFFGPLLLQWDEVKMEGRGEGVWNECDDSWEWIQWKYRCLQTKPRKVHLQLFQVRKKQIDFLFAVFLLFLIVLLYVNSPRGGSRSRSIKMFLCPQAPNLSKKCPPKSA